jgi:hypothetical protein
MAALMAASGRMTGIAYRIIGKNAISAPIKRFDGTKYKSTKVQKYKNTKG